MTSNIAAALAKAQAEMGKAIKESTNPAFRSKYADLGNVMDACLPALNKHNIAVIQPIVSDMDGRFVKTILIHESGETLECAVPLIVGKNDMQGLGSAITYGRRYGLMSMAGIAPEDDDGNAAAKGNANISEDQYIELQRLIDTAGIAESVILTAEKVAALHFLPERRFSSVKAKLEMTIKNRGAAQ